MIGDTLAADRRYWRIALFACALFTGVNAGFAPLADPDLPMHLVVGEWIIRHGTVPFVEPFAWTRLGDPFFAYSWLPQIAFYALMRTMGAVGLHVLAAAIAMGIVYAGAIMSRALGQVAPATVVVGALSGYVALEATPFLRPQLVMFLLAPLCWASVARYLDAPESGRLALLGLFCLSAAAANTHISFPVTAAPLALVLVRQPPARRAAAAIAATVAGWMLSPYALVWPAVFRLNFVRNLITTEPGLVGELQPGFSVAPLLGGLLASLPLWTTSSLTPRERLVYGAGWLAGLLAFATAYKGLGPWWWCATPLLAIALTRLPWERVETRRGWVVAGGLAVLAAIALPNVVLLQRLGDFEGSDSARRLPSIKAFAAEPIAAWMEARLRPNVPGRLLTTFEYGSYLRWRLPSLSESIDSRNIFPDSVVLSTENYRGTPRLGPWRSADVAIFPESYPLATTLDADPDWQRVMVAPPPPWAPKARRAGLWLRRSWWQGAVRGERGTAPP